MTTERIDVLAVMDRDIAKRSAEWDNAWKPFDSGEIPPFLSDAMKARAAVAELIEAAKVFANDDRQRAWHPAYRPQMDALHAALARVGGA